jgi:UMF1 family MFS transporter
MARLELERNPITISSWVIYDMANTMFSAGVVGLVFPLWVISHSGGDDATVGYTLTVAMALVFFLSPLVGFLSDRLKRRMPFLLVLTLCWIVSTVLIGTWGLKLSLLLVVSALVFIQLANIFYNGLLGDLSTNSNAGLIGGIGVGLGYIGAITAVAMSILLLEDDGHVNLFRLMGFCSLVFTAPLLVAGRYRISMASGSLFAEVFTETLRLMKSSFQRSVTNSNWMRFLISRFWYLWAVNAASSFAVLYAVQTVKMSETEVQMILAIGIVTGIPMGAFWGWVVDKIGALHVLKVNVLGWVLLLAIAAAIPLMTWPSSVWWFVGSFSGTILSGLYVAERPIVLAMAPLDRRSEYFAMFTMSGRLAAIVAPFSWGMVSTTLRFGQPAAMATLAICALIALGFISVFRQWRTI